MTDLRVAGQGGVLGAGPALVALTIGEGSFGGALMTSARSIRTSPFEMAPAESGCGATKAVGIWLAGAAMAAPGPIGFGPAEPGPGRMGVVRSGETACDMGGGPSATGPVAVGAAGTGMPWSGGVKTGGVKTGGVKTGGVKTGAKKASAKGVGVDGGVWVATDMGRSTKADAPKGGTYAVAMMRAAGTGSAVVWDEAAGAGLA